MAPYRPGQGLNSEATARLRQRHQIRTELQDDLLRCSQCTKPFTFGHKSLCLGCATGKNSFRDESHQVSASTSTNASPRSITSSSDGCSDVKTCNLVDVASPETLKNIPSGLHCIPITSTCDKEDVNEWCVRHVLSKKPDYPRVGIKAGDQCGSHWQDWHGVGADGKPFARGGYAKALAAGEATNIRKGPQILTKDMDPYMMIPMIQLATPNAVLIYHIQRATGTFPIDFPVELRKVLESHAIMKGGVSAFVKLPSGVYSGDVVGIREHCGVDVANFVEMQQRDWCPDRGNPLSCVYLAQRVLGICDWKPKAKVTDQKPLVIDTTHGSRKLRFDDLKWDTVKDNAVRMSRDNAVRLSKWDEDLCNEQLFYAAMDALANSLLLETLILTPIGLQASADWRSVVTHEQEMKFTWAARCSSHQSDAEQLLVKNTFLEYKREPALRRCRSDSELHLKRPCEYQVHCPQMLC